MEMKKKTMAALPMCYCLAIMDIGGRPYCITASEARDGKVLLIDLETGHVEEVKGLEGGIMSIVPVPEEDGAFYAIQKFYPIFDSQKAEIVYGKIAVCQGKIIEVDIKTVCNLPYVHRIALTGHKGARKLVAATLCTKKEYTEDWSSPGGVYIVKPSDQAMRDSRKMSLIEGIYKNHGMFCAADQGIEHVYVAGQEGIFSIETDNWEVNQISEQPTSDFCLFDVDGDGKKETIVISPFHGDRLMILKNDRENQESLCAETVLPFGHALWCGGVCGETWIIACSRGEERETVLYSVQNKQGGISLSEKQVIDVGGGATNIVVQTTDAGIIMYAANHYAGEIVKYEIDANA